MEPKQNARIDAFKERGLTRDEMHRRPVASRAQGRVDDRDKLPSLDAGNAARHLSRALGGARNTMSLQSGPLYRMLAAIWPHTPMGRKNVASLPEGEENASLGSMTAFYGFLAILLALAALFGKAIAPCVLSLLCALFGIWTGRRATLLTRRNLALARVGTAMSLVAILCSLVAAALIGLNVATRNQ